MESESRPEKGKAYIFRPRYERAYFSLLTLIFAIAIAASFDLLPMPTIKEHWVKCVVFLLLFNQLHILLTFVGIALVPELRAWFRTQFQPRRIGIVSLIFVAIFYISWVGLKSLDKGAIDGALLTTIFVLLASIHNPGQTKGLSMLYNRAVRDRLSEAEKVQQLKVERNEKWIFSILMASLAVLAIATSLFHASVSPKRFVYLNLFFIGFSVLLVANSLRYPQLFKSNKFYFTQGIWLYAWAPVVPVLTLFQMGMHGVEYVMLGDVVVNQSKASLTRKRIFIAFGVMILFAVFKAFDSRKFFGGFKVLDQRSITAIVIFCTFVEYLHFYVDSIMFKFNDPSVKAHIAPLFSAEAPV